jgi:hypothetical protein
MTRTSYRFRHQFPKSSVGVLTFPAPNGVGYRLRTLLDQ